MKCHKKNCCSIAAAVLLAAALSGCGKTTQDAPVSVRPPAYDLIKMGNPERNGVLLDLAHHFRIDLHEPGKPVMVTLPVNPGYLRNTDIGTLALARHASNGMRGYTEAIPLKWSTDGKATVELSEPGIYSLIGAPADVLSRSLLKAFCGSGKVPRLCLQIDCASQPVGDTPAYVPGVPPCEFCTRLQPGDMFAECLLDIRDVLYPPRLQPQPDANEPACEFRKVFDESFCSFRPQAGNEQQCMELAQQFDDVWASDLTGQSCVCGTRVRSSTWDPPPNGCTDAFEGEFPCIGWNWNCEAVAN